MDLSLPFVCCTVCQQRPANVDLFLTSCAHILCREHASRNAQDPNRLESTKTRCVTCNHEYVSLVKIDKRLPNEISTFFIPFPAQIEQMFASAQFQYNGLGEKINYQNQIITRLTGKVNTQKQLLSLAKEKVLQVETLENRIKEQELEIQSLKSQQRSTTSTIRNLSPQTVDLTGDDSFEEVQQQPQIGNNRRIVTNSFLNQVTKSTTQRGLQNYRPSSLTGAQRPERTAKQSTNHHHLQPEGSHINIDFAKSSLGESTNILHNSPLRSNLMSVSSTGTSARNSLSNGSMNTSFSSHDQFLPPGTQLKSKMLTAQQVPPSSTNLLRASKNRASTTNLAQRLSAHMKIGGSLNRPSSHIRPGSAFTSGHNILKRR